MAPATRRRASLGGAAVLLALLAAWCLSRSPKAPVADPVPADPAGAATAPPLVAGLRPADEPRAHANRAEASGAAPAGDGVPGAAPGAAAAVPAVGPGTADDPELPPERVPLDVVVVDPLGVPVPGAQLVAVWGEWRTRVVAAGAEGKVTLQVPRGTRSLEVVGVEGGDPRPFLFVHYHSLSGGESATRVVVRTGSGVDGTLVGPGGEPIPGAIVRIVPAVYGYGAVRTDTEGAFHLGALAGQRVDVRFDGEVADPAPPPIPSGSFRVSIGSAGESAHTRIGSLRALATGVLPGPDRLVLRAEPAARRADLVVVVLDPAGRGVERAIVKTVGTGVEACDAAGVETDASGRAVLRDLPAWPTTVNATRPRRTAGAPVSWGRLRADVRLPAPAEATPGGPTLVLRCRKDATLVGRVVDAAGNPVAKAWCAAFDGHAYAACFGTDSDGRFESAANVPPGTRLTVSARFPMEKPVATGVLDGVLAGDGDLRIVLRPTPGR